MRIPEEFGFKVTVKQTGDGSQTLFVPELNEHYHSVHGAIHESMHIYIGCGLHHVALNKPEIAILEVGFGTGLNALLTCIEARQKNMRIRYASIEKYPVSAKILTSLNYPQILDFPGSFDFFNQIIEGSWNKESRIHERFSLHKIHGGIESVELPEAQYDVIYYDAFGPEVQPEMWTESVFHKLYHCLREGGVLVTYSSKGNVKRALISAGFLVKKLPGPPGKREIVRAVK